MRRNSKVHSQESRTIKFMYNSLTTVIYQVVVMIVGFTLPRVMLNYYGSEINGLVSSITQFISYFSLVEAGLAGAAVYSLYKPLAEENNKEISSVITATKKFYNQSGILFVILVILLSLLYPIFVKSNSLSFELIAILVLILGVKGSLEFFSLAKYRALLTADQKTYIISVSSTVYVILNAIIVIVLSIFKINIVLVNLIATLALFIRSIILSYYVRKNYTINYREKPNLRALDKRWDAFYLQILGVVQNGAPVVLATIFTSIKTVSIYSIYNMVLTGVNGVLSIFTSGLSATFGDLIIRKEVKRFQKAYKDFEYVYYILITIIYSVSFNLIMPFIRIYTKGINDVNYYLPDLGFLIVLNGLLYNIKTPQGMLIISAGLYKETRIQSTFQALIIIIMGVILSPKWGLNGIIIASCLSNLYRSIDLIYYVTKHITYMPKILTIRRWIRIIMIIMMNSFVYIKLGIYPITLIQWVIYAVFITIITSIIVIVVNFMIERKQMADIFFRMINIIRR